MSAPATATPTPQTPARSVPTRRIQFDYPTETLPRHYAGGDLVMSHVVTVLSSLFPEGEDFFVRSVRNYRDQITDPELKRQVAGFIGQEAIHGREHRSFNERLGQLGYPTRFLDRTTRFIMRVATHLPKSAQLAITAALEHYTATLAFVLLDDPEAQAMLHVDEVRGLFTWHALEESEHKAVAFDVFQAVSGKHWVRVRTMNAVTAAFLTVLITGTLLSLAGDRAAYNPRRLFRSARAMRRSPWLRRPVIRHLFDYLRRDFHPDDHDSTTVLEEWRTKLFGTDGSLAGRLKTSS